MSVTFRMVFSKAFLLLALSTHKATCFTVNNHIPTITSFTNKVLSPNDAKAPISVIQSSSSSRLYMADAAESISIDDITAELQQHKQEFDSKINDATSLSEVETVRVEYLGKKGPINKVMSYMRNLPNEDKPKLGSAVNQIKNELEVVVNQRKEEMGYSAEETQDAVEESAAVREESKTEKKKKTPPADVAGDIDVSKLDIRVGVITKAWLHEEADKLFCEEIDIGEEEGPRKIASGLRAHYNLEDLEGQRVLVLANLKTRKLVGFPSHGMVLCAASEDSSKVEFIEPPADAKLGERVMCDGFDGEPVSC